MNGLLVLTFVGQAQSCIAQTYIAPVQYQQQYYNQAYVEKTIFVAVEPQEAQAYYGGLVATQQRQVERQAQAQQAVSTTEAKIDALTRLVTDLQRRLDAQPQQPLLPDRPARTPSPLLPPVPAVSPVAAEAAPPPPTVAAASSQRGAGLALLSRKCASCHAGGAAAGGGHRLFSADGQFLVRDQDTLASIEAEIVSGRMPKRQQQLTLREYVAVRDFLNEQAGTVALTSNPRKRTQ